MPAPVETFNVVVLHGVDLADGTQRVVAEFCEEARIAVARIKPGQALIHANDIEVSYTIEEALACCAGVLVGDARVTTRPGLGRILASFALALSEKRVKQIEAKP